MLNLEFIEEKYQEYKRKSRHLEKLEKEFANYKEKYKVALEEKLPIYQKLKDSCTRKEENLVTMYLENNPVLQKYEQLRRERNILRKERIEIINNQNIVDLYQRFVALKHEEDDNYDLLELYTQEKLDLSQFGEEKSKFIVDLLRSASSFLGYANRSDLPLLMNLLDEYDASFCYDNIEAEDMDEERYLHEESKSRNIELELIRAHMKDDKVEEIKDKCYNGTKIITQYYIPEEDVSKMLQKIEFRREILGEETYRIQYYMLSMLKNNIEELYLTTPEENKENFLDAYMALSKGVFIDCSTLPKDFYVQYRTSSSLINIEVLKRKVLTKNKQCK